MAGRSKDFPKIRRRRFKIHPKIYPPMILFCIIYIALRFYQTKPPKVKSTSLAADCDLFSGKWVYDNKLYPLYSEKSCPYKYYGIACETFGRKDLEYQHWMWKPHNCDLPRFNAKSMLEMLRGKRLVFVGDSLARNQWASLTCMLESSIPPASKSVYPDGNLNFFKAKEYNASVEFYWSPYLVESNSDHPTHHHARHEQILRVQSIEKHARQWNDADVLIFDAYSWWIKPNYKVVWGSFENADKFSKDVDGLRVLEMALQTWSDWLEIHVNRSKTKVFFLSASPTHEKGNLWGKARGDNCYNETEPILEEGYRGSELNPKLIQVVDDVIKRLETRGFKIHVLNITTLSEYRKDGHSSTFRREHWKDMTKEELADPRKHADCLHWCIPGVPDVWNEILYSYLLFH